MAARPCLGVDGRLRIYSFAHGSIDYKLRRKSSPEAEPPPPPVDVKELSRIIAELVTRGIADAKPVRKEGRALMQVLKYPRDKDHDQAAALALLRAHPDGSPPNLACGSRTK